MAAPDPKNAFWRLWQQAGDAYTVNRLCVSAIGWLAKAILLAINMVRIYHQH